MAEKYLLQCDCGKQPPVSPKQAGNRIRCECGNLLDVPTLGKLRYLPIGQENPTGKGEVRGNSPTWGLRQAIASAGIIAAVGFLVAAAYFWATEPEVPHLDPVQSKQELAAHLEESAPVDLWRLWQLDYSRLADRGFLVFETPERDHIQRIAAQQRLYRNGALVLAGVSALLSGVGYFLAPRPKSHQR